MILCRFACLAVLAVVFVPRVPAQQTPPAQSVDGTASRLTLEVVLPQLRDDEKKRRQDFRLPILPGILQVGDAVWIKMTIENTGSSPVTLRLPPAASDLKITVYRQEGTSQVTVPYTQEGKRLYANIKYFGGHPVDDVIYYPVQPKEKIVNYFVLNSIVDMSTPGDYYVRMIQFYEDGSADSKAFAPPLKVTVRARDFLTRKVPVLARQSADN